MVGISENHDAAEMAELGVRVRIRTLRRNLQNMRTRQDC